MKQVHVYNKLSWLHLIFYKLNDIKNLKLSVRI